MKKQVRAYIAVTADSLDISTFSYKEGGFPIAVLRVSHEKGGLHFPFVSV